MASPLCPVRWGSSLLQPSVWGLQMPCLLSACSPLASCRQRPLYTDVLMQRPRPLQCPHQSSGCRSRWQRAGSRASIGQAGQCGPWVAGPGLGIWGSLGLCSAAPCPAFQGSCLLQYPAFPSLGLGWLPQAFCFCGSSLVGGRVVFSGPLSWRECASGAPGQLALSIHYKLLFFVRGLQLGQQWVA